MILKTPKFGQSEQNLAGRTEKSFDQKFSASKVVQYPVFLQATSFELQDFTSFSLL